LTCVVRRRGGVLGTPLSPSSLKLGRRLLGVLIESASASGYTPAHPGLEVLARLPDDGVLRGVLPCDPGLEWLPEVDDTEKKLFFEPIWQAG